MQSNLEMHNSCRKAKAAYMAANKTSRRTPATSETGFIYPQTQRKSLECA